MSASIALTQHGAGEDDTTTGNRRVRCSRSFVRSFVCLLANASAVAIYLYLYLYLRFHRCQRCACLVVATPPPPPPPTTPQETGELRDRARVARAGAHALATLRACYVGGRADTPSRRLRAVPKPPYIRQPPFLSALVLYRTPLSAFPSPSSFVASAYTFLPYLIT